MSELLKHHPHRPSCLQLVTGAYSGLCGWSTPLAGNNLALFSPQTLQNSIFLPAYLCLMAMPYGYTFQPSVKPCFWGWHTGPSLRGWKGDALLHLHSLIWVLAILQGLAQSLLTTQPHATPQLLLSALFAELSQHLSMIPGVGTFVRKAYTALDCPRCDTQLFF